MRAQLPSTPGGRMARGRPPFGPPTSAFPALQRHCSARTSAIARIPGHRCDFQRSPSALPVPRGSHVCLPSLVRLKNRRIPRLRMSNSTIPTTQSGQLVAIKALEMWGYAPAKPVLVAGPCAAPALPTSPVAPEGIYVRPRRGPHIRCGPKRKALTISKRFPSKSSISTNCRLQWRRGFALPKPPPSWRFAHLPTLPVRCCHL